MNDPTIAFGFARRQTPSSRFSHTTLTEAEVVARVLANWGRKKPTYRKYNEVTGLCDKYGLPFGGVISVPVEPGGFFSGVCELQDGDKLVGTYESRRAGEEPRKSISVAGREKMPAQYVEIILYHADVLAEDEPEKDRTYEWEIVSINASPTDDEDIPIRPMTLLHNHFQSTGGTSTGQDAEVILAKLQVAFDYWKDKALAAGDE